MTDEQTLADAIAEVKRRFVRGRTWDSCDIDVLSIQYYGPSIARILNAVVAGELVPPATECPFGDDCDLTVAYMAGAASKKNASMMTRDAAFREGVEAADHKAVKVGNIENYYGGLWLMREGGKDFWCIENYTGHEWEPCDPAVANALRALAQKEPNDE